MESNYAKRLERIRQATKEGFTKYIPETGQLTTKAKEQEELNRKFEEK